MIKESFRAPTLAGKDREEILDALAISVPFIQQLFPLDCAVAVTDGERFLSVVPGEGVDPELNPGDQIPPEDVNPEVIRTGQMQTTELSAEVYGIPLRSVVVPIKDAQGCSIGTLDIGINLSTKNELLDIAGSVEDYFSQLTTSSEQLSTMATELNQAQQELQELTQQASAHLGKTNSILDLIQGLASQANLLGINAAIEAARSGENGRGFAVVADEIRNMANSTAKSAGDIDQIIKELNRFITQVQDFVDTNEQRASELAAASEQITGNMEEKSQAVHTLQEVARLL